MSEKRQTNKFDSARLKAFWHEILALLTRRDNHLVAWERVREELRFEGGTPRTLKTVPLDRIVGTVGRYEDFDRAFLPTHDGLADRWRSVESAFDAGLSLPPVRLYQVGDAFFVVDGHHRVSVARQRGIKHLEARVVEVNARVPVSGHLDASELELRGEYTRFLERTSLDEHRPEQCIEFTIRGAYARLVQHIALFADSSDLQDTAPLPKEAVCEWYDQSYLPLISVIREQNILADFPRRTEADLYLWLTENLADLRAQCGPEVDLERAADHFAERHGRHLLARATSFLRHWLSEDACDLVTR
jgi:hypothetical protein